jgi:hypothetical protein
MNRSSLRSNRLKFKTSEKKTPHFLGIYGIHLQLMKQSRKIITCNLLGWTWNEALEFWTIISPDSTGRRPCKHFRIRQGWKNESSERSGAANVGWLSKFKCTCTIPRSWIGTEPPLEAIMDDDGEEALVFGRPCAPLPACHQLPQHPTRPPPLLRPQQPAGPMHPPTQDYIYISLAMQGKARLLHHSCLRQQLWCFEADYAFHHIMSFIIIFVNLGLFRHFEIITNIRTWIKSHRYWRTFKMQILWSWCSYQEPPNYELISR